MLKLPKINFNPKVLILASLALGSVLVPQYAAYLGAVSATIESQSNVASSDPVVSVGTFGCKHIQQKEIINGQ